MTSYLIACNVICSDKLNALKVLSMLETEKRIDVLDTLRGSRLRGDADKNVVMVILLLLI